MAGCGLLYGQTESRLAKEMVAEYGIGQIKKLDMVFIPLHEQFTVQLRKYYEE